jgi:hypothetical protein
MGGFVALGVVFLLLARDVASNGECDWSSPVGNLDMSHAFKPGTTPHLGTYLLVGWVLLTIGGVLAFRRWWARIVGFFPVVLVGLVAVLVVPGTPCHVDNEAAGRAAAALANAGAAEHTNDPYVFAREAERVLDESYALPYARVSRCRRIWWQSPGRSRWRCYVTNPERHRERTVMFRVADGRLEAVRRDALP